MDLEMGAKQGNLCGFFLGVLLIDCLTVSLFASGSFTTAYRSNPFGFGFGFGNCRDTQGILV